MKAVTETVVVVRCVRCKAEREVHAGGDPDDVPMCERCFSPMVAVRAIRRPAP